MKFKTARNIAAACYTIALIVLVIGVLNAEVHSQFRTIAIIIGVVLILVGAYVRLNGCKCPACGEQVTGRLLDTTKCPKCGAELMPKKEKKKE